MGETGSCCGPDNVAGIARVLMAAFGRGFNHGLPAPILDAFIAALDMTLVLRWLVDARHRPPTPAYLLVVMMTVTAGFAGFPKAIPAGTEGVVIHTALRR